MKNWFDCSNLSILKENSVITLKDNKLGFFYEDFSGLLISSRRFRTRIAILLKKQGSYMHKITGENYQYQCWQCYSDGNIALIEFYSFNIDNYKIIYAF